MGFAPQELNGTRSGLAREPSVRFQWAGAAAMCERVRSGLGGPLASTGAFLNLYLFNSAPLHEHCPYQESAGPIVHDEMR